MKLMGSSHNNAMSLPRKPLLRLVTLLALVILAFLFTNIFERRRTAYSCRTFWSCLGFGRSHAYHHPIPSASNITEEEVVLRDGSIRWERNFLNASAHPSTIAPEVLFLVLIKDATSWSSDFRSTERSVYDFIDLLISTEGDMSVASLAMMTADVLQYEALKIALPRLSVARTTLLLRNDIDTGVSYSDRHAPAAQLARRSAIAKMRNYLMLSSLRDERHIVWLDADVVELSKGIVQAMLEHAESNEDAGIITAECRQNQMDNYDKNAWKLAPDTSDRLMGTISDSDHDKAVEELLATRLFIPELIEGTSDSDLIPLDSVGGTILYIRADLVRQGVTFPLQNVVGTTWKGPGWTGVETEGICYVARGARGGGCYVLGGGHFVRHTDWG